MLKNAEKCCKMQTNAEKCKRKILNTAEMSTTCDKHKILLDKKPIFNPS